MNCLLFIMPANMAMNILGMPVHVDYYSIHDPVNGTVRWAPHNNSPKDTIQEGPVPPPNRLLKAGEPGPDPTILLLLILVAAGICYGCIFLWKEWLYQRMVDAGYSKSIIKLLSGVYFLTAALFTVYAIWPVVIVLISN